MNAVSTPRFLSLLLLFTAIVFGSHYGAYALIDALVWPNVVFLQYGFFVVVTFGIHTVLMIANKQSSKLFVNAFLGLMSAKMFFSLIIILLYLVVIKDRPMAFSLNFLMY